ncbi:MAG TPA: HAD-IA family hydrolase [Kiritimatiellia bacterium]|nr:HAD-IA family hydrolase [Kiritimatiellia bacterium]
MKIAGLKQQTWFQQIRAISFDCYGTLIDWEEGICRAMLQWADDIGISISREEILSLYSRFEPEEQLGEYRTYREILYSVQKRFAGHYRVSLKPNHQLLLAQSLADWEPFADTNQALQRLAKQYKLAVISNIDHDLFAGTRAKLEPVIDCLVTAEDVSAYKPAHRNFEKALEKMGLERSRLLHVAESLYHDIKPCNDLGIRCVWVNRRSRSMSVGATRLETARPDAVVESLAEFVEAIV